MDGMNNSRRSSASSSHQTFMDLQHREKAELKRVIDFLQEQYEGLASELASKDLQLKVAKSRRMPSGSFQLKNQEYQAKSELNQLKFRHMTELQEAMSEHQLEMEIIKEDFESRMHKQSDEFKREFARVRKEQSGKLGEELIELSQKNIELNRTIARHESKIQELERKTSGPEAGTENKQLKQTLIEKQAEISRLERRLRDSEQYAEELKTKLTEKNKEIDYFVTEIGRQKPHSRSSFLAQKAYNKLDKTDNYDLGEQLCFLKEQNDRLKKLNDCYKGTVTDREDQIQDLNSKNTQLGKEAVSKATQIESLNREVSELLTSKKIFQAQISRLNENIQANMSLINQKHSQVMALQVQVQKLKGDNELCVIRLADQKLQKRRLEEQITRQNDRLGTLEEEVRNSNSKLSKKQDTISEMCRETESHKSDCKLLEVALQSKQSEYQLVCLQNRSYIAQVQATRAQNADTVRSCEDLKHRLRKSEQDSKDLLQSLKELKVQYQDVRIQNSTLKVLEEAQAHLKNEIGQLEQQLKLAKDDLKKQIEQAYVYKVDLERTREQLQEAGLRLQDHQKERVQSLNRNQLAEQLKKYSQMAEITSRLNNQLNSEIKQLNGVVSKLTQDKNQLERKLERMEDKVQKGRETQKSVSVGQLQSEITRLQISIANFQNQRDFSMNKAEQLAREKQKTILLLQNQLSDMASRTQREQEILRSESQAMHKLLSESREELQRLRTGTEALTLDNTKLKAASKYQHEMQSLERQTLKEELKKKTNECENIGRKWSTFREQQMQRFSADRQVSMALESELSACKTRLQLAQSALRDRQGDLEKLANKNNRNLSEKGELELELDQLKGAQWKRESAIQALARDKQSLARQLKNKESLYRQEVNSLKHNNQELSTNNEQLADHVRQLQKEYNRVQSQNQTLSQCISKLGQERDQLSDVRSKLEIGLTSARVEMDGLRRKQPQLLSPRTTTSEINKCKQDLQKQKSLRLQLEKDIESLKRQDDQPAKESASKIGELEQENRRLVDQARISNLEFAQLLKYRSDLQMKLIQTGDQLRKTRQELGNKPSHDSFVDRGQTDTRRSDMYIKQLEMRVRLVEDINNQLRKKEQEHQDKTNRIISETKADLTRLKAQNIILSKENLELQTRIVHISNQLKEGKCGRLDSKDLTTEELIQLKEEQRSLYDQVHNLNNLLFQKESQITLLRNKGLPSHGGPESLGSPKQKKLLRNNQECWRDIQEKIKAGHKEYTRNRLSYS